LGGNLKRNKGAQHWAAIWKLPLRDDCWYNDNSPHTLIQSAIVLLNIVCVLFLSLLRQQEEK
jgi:hypothetical protein